jgi:hypothetical protein
VSAAESFERWAIRVGADKDLDPVARHILVALATFANRRRGGWAWPSVDTLTDATGWGATAVRAALARIEAAGILEVDRRPGHATRWCFPTLGITATPPPGELTPPPGEGTPPPGGAVSTYEAHRSTRRARARAPQGAQPVDDLTPPTDPAVAARYLSQIRANLNHRRCTP